MPSHGRSTCVQLAIFDLDGTLMQTSAVDDDCYARAMADVFGIRGMSNDWGSYSHSTDGAILGDLIRERLGREASAEDAAAQRARFVELLSLEPASRFEPTPGASSILAELRGAGWTTAIATGGWEQSARLKLARGGLDIGDIPAAFADDALPREQIVRTAIARAANGWTGPIRAVYVGDGLWDLRAARSLGMGFVGLARGERADRLRTAGAPIVLTDFADHGATRAALEQQATSWST